MSYCGPACQKKDWSRHKRLCVPVMIKDIEGKGRGLVASKNFQMGDLILKERAVATIRSKGSEAGPEILSQFNKMTSDERSDFCDLTNGHMDDIQGRSDLDRHLSEVTSKFNNNAVFSGSGNETGSLFLTYALINHCCSPNVFMDLTYGDETRGEVRALRNIKKGEEITDTYIMLGYLNKYERQRELKKWGFICNCHSCTSGDEEDLIDETSKIENDIRQHVSKTKSDKNKTDWARIAQMQDKVVTNLQQLSFSSLLLPMEIVDLVCMSQIGRQQHLVSKGMELLGDIVEQRKVGLYRKNYKKLQKRLETWHKNLEQNLPLTDMELECFSGFRIDVNDL